jgi:hypothetical protein
MLFGLQVGECPKPKQEQVLISQAQGKNGTKCLAHSTMCANCPGPLPRHHLILAPEKIVGSIQKYTKII